MYILCVTSLFSLHPCFFPTRNYTTPGTYPSIHPSIYLFLFFLCVCISATVFLFSVFPSVIDQKPYSPFCGFFFPSLLVPIVTYIFHKKRLPFTSIMTMTLTISMHALDNAVLMSANYYYKASTSSVSPFLFRIIAHLILVTFSNPHPHPSPCKINPLFCGPGPAPPQQPHVHCM